MVYYSRSSDSNYGSYYRQPGYDIRRIYADQRSHAIEFMAQNENPLPFRRKGTTFYSRHQHIAIRRLCWNCIAFPGIIQNGSGLWPGHHRYHRSEEHTSELQSRLHLVCRLLLEKKKKNKKQEIYKYN